MVLINATYGPMELSTSIKEPFVNPLRVARDELQPRVADNARRELVNRYAKTSVGDLRSEQQRNPNRDTEDRKKLLHNPRTQTLYVEPDEIRGLHAKTLLDS
jgi:hypothetical protein